MAQDIQLKVNEEMNEVSVEPWETLLEVLRYRLGLTKIKESCGWGDCGSCSVL
jgi:carbon-monoxide dehydrogenase small subunit